MKGDPTKIQELNEFKARIMRIFSADATVRDDAHQALKEAWAHDTPSFRTEELEDPTVATDKCVVMAARRDGQKEVLDWLMKIHHKPEA